MSEEIQNQVEPGVWECQAELKTPQRPRFCRSLSPCVAPYWKNLGGGKPVQKLGRGGFSSVPSLSQLVTLRGSILEDATPTATKAGTVRGLPLRDVLEHVVPELNPQCLRLALGGPRVAEQLLKLDEQGVSDLAGDGMPGTPASPWSPPCVPAALPTPQGGDSVLQSGAELRGGDVQQ